MDEHVATHVPIVGHLEVPVRRDAVHRLHDSGGPRLDEAAEHRQRGVHDLGGELPGEVEKPRHVAAGAHDFLPQPFHRPDEVRAAHAPAHGAEQGGANDRSGRHARHTVDLLEHEVRQGLQQHRPVAGIGPRVEPSPCSAAPLQQGVLRDVSLGAKERRDSHMDVAVATAGHLHEMPRLLHHATETLLLLLCAEEFGNIGPRLHHAVVVHRHGHEVGVLHSARQDGVQQHAQHAQFRLQQLAASTPTSFGEELEVHTVLGHELHVGRDDRRV
mmetsp:Transcript_4455/g.12843  ORF Transcript_4455/g.12843 Transcript_4455/m.12843 type:complete len:272 (-) Transcript_4455:774-1589(-)